MSGPGQQHWCVVGGGMLGLVLALRLRQAGHAVTVCEAAPAVGGLAAVWEIDGIVWDKHYHVILPDDRQLLALLDEIGLAREVRWVRSRTGFFADGRLVPLDGALDYLRFPFLGPLAKVRLAMTLAMAARIRDGRRLERIGVEDWLVRWSGRQAFERIWRPLLQAKLGANYRHTSAAFIWAIIRRLYLARRNHAKTETLGFVEGGYARILEALRRHLEAAGVAIETSCAITRIENVTDGMRIETGRGTGYADQVVVTLPAALTVRLCPGLEAAERDRLTAVRYQGILCATVLLSRPLTGNYLTYLADDDLPFTAVIEMSALVGTERFAGRSLVYLPRYATMDDPYWDLDDDTIRERFLAGLGRIVPDLQPGQVAAFRLSRVRHVLAVPSLHYTDRRPPVRTSVAGLHIVNSAQIVNGTLNVNETLTLAAAAAPALLRTPGPDRAQAAREQAA